MFYRSILLILLLLTVHVLKLRYKGKFGAKYKEPVIRLSRVDEQQSSRFVLLLDVSQSMRNNGS